MAKIIPNVGGIGGGRPWGRMLRTAGLVLALVLLAGGVGVGLRWFQQRGDTTQTPLNSLPKEVSDAQNLRLSGDAEEADKKIQESLDDPSLDSNTRYELYMQQGHSFVDKKEYQKAIEAYKEAEKVDATRSVAWVLGDMYRNLKNTTQAVTYYKMAIERVPANDPLAEADTEYLQKLVQDLEAE